MIDSEWDSFVEWIKETWPRLKNATSIEFSALHARFGRLPFDAVQGAFWSWKIENMAKSLPDYSEVYRRAVCGIEPVENESWSVNDECILAQLREVDARMNPESPNTDEYLIRQEMDREPPSRQARDRIRSAILKLVGKDCPVDTEGVRRKQKEQMMTSRELVEAQSRKIKSTNIDP